MSLGDDWPDLLTVKEVAKILRVAPLTVKRWGKRGKLPAIRINSRGDRRYKKEAVLWLLGATQTQKSPTETQIYFNLHSLFLAVLSRLIIYS